MRKKKDDEIQLFRRSVSQLPRTQRYVREYFCELLGSIILSACLVWAAAASLAIINYMVNSKFPYLSLNRQHFHVL